MPTMLIFFIKNYTKKQTTEKASRVRYYYPHTQTWSYSSRVTVGYCILSQTNHIHVPGSLEFDSPEMWCSLQLLQEA